MLNSSALKTLASFSVQDFKDFKDFVSSPFFNKNENVVKLFKYLRKFHPDYKDENLEKENIYRRLFDKGEYNDGFMRTLIFSLNKLLEEYLIYINHSKDKVKRGINLLNEVNDRKIEKVFMKAFNNTEDINESMSVKNPDYFNNKYNLTLILEKYNLWNRSEYHSDLEELFKNSYDNLTHYYLGSLLREYRYLLHRNEIKRTEFRSEFLEHILDYLSGRDNQYILNPVINVHLNEIYLLKNKSEKYFYILKKVLKNNADKLSIGDRFSLHNILQVFCINKVFEGEKKFVHERMELYKIILGQKLYSPVSEDYFEDTMFANIVNLGLSLKEYTWVENFIEEFSSKLSPANMNTLINYSRAKLNFEKNNFDEALKHLNSISNIKHRELKFPVRTLTLMTLYELDSMTQVFYNIDSFRHFMTKNKTVLMPERFERISNFLRSFTKLARLKEKMNKAEFKKLGEEIRNNTNTLERNWLLKKTGKLSAK
ncbi:MAG TPA: hypothetical protein PKC91_14670 [Ignavibacteria bacterium]|nr:hypothetical protein [Ignavibacteria bacterium]